MHLVKDARHSELARLLRKFAQNWPDGCREQLFCCGDLVPAFVQPSLSIAPCRQPAPPSFGILASLINELLVGLEDEFGSIRHLLERERERRLSLCESFPMQSHGTILQGSRKVGCIGSTHAPSCICDQRPSARLASFKHEFVQDPKGRHSEPFTPQPQTLKHSPFTLPKNPYPQTGLGFGV